MYRNIHLAVEFSNRPNMVGGDNYSAISQKYVLVKNVKKKEKYLEIGRLPWNRGCGLDLHGPPIFIPYAICIQQTMSCAIDATNYFRTDTGRTNCPFGNNIVHFFVAFVI